MQALYAKLYDKYSKLKTNRWLEVDEVNREQEVKFINYVSAADELIEHLRNENERLRAQVNDLTNEVASIRSTKHEQFTEYQRLSMEDKQKNKELLEEIERLQNLQREGLCCSVKDDRIENGQLNKSGGSQVGSEAFNHLATSTMRKRSRHPGTETEVSVSPTASDQLEHALVIESANDLTKQTMSSSAPFDIHQPECCRRKIDSSGGGADVTDPANCVFQDLVECLLGMKLSTVIQADGICLSALHQSTGYSFSLTWINKSYGVETELLYRVLSLGTFERVAPEWMREVLMFSTGMCPVFFERISRIIKLYH